MANILPPFNLHQWISENKHLLKPPIGNQQIYKYNQDFIVMVVGGPNARKDFHYNEGEELFYQIEGTIELHIIQDQTFQIVTLSQGDMFLLPPKVYHSPRRGKDTVGLVIERYRKENELDGFYWFCEKCQSELHHIYLPVKDIVQQLPIVMNDFYSSKELCTCKACGHYMQRP